METVNHSQSKIHVDSIKAKKNLMLRVDRLELLYSEDTMSVRFQLNGWCVTQSLDMFINANREANTGEEYLGNVDKAQNQIK